MLGNNFYLFKMFGYRKSYDKLYSISLYINSEQITLDPFPKFLELDTFDPKVSFTNNFRNIERHLQNQYPKNTQVKSRL